MGNRQTRKKRIFQRLRVESRTVRNYFNCFEVVAEYDALSESVEEIKIGPFFSDLKGNLPYD